MNRHRGSPLRRPYKRHKAPRTARTRFPRPSVPDSSDFYALTEQFPTEASAERYFTDKRWNERRQNW